MAEMELTPIQKEILTALISIYHQNKKAVKGEDIAKMIDRNPGTIRNQMQALKALGLIEGVPGPKGGYKATARAYRALTIDVMEKEASVPVRRNVEIVKDIVVEEISFTTPRHPELCNSSIRMLGDIRKFNVGDKIEIGPTPVNKLVVRGEVIGRDDTENKLICAISEMISLPKRPVIEYVEDLVRIPADASVQDASKILLEKNIWSAPVMDGEKVIGIASLKDIGKAVSIGKTNAKILDFAQRKVLSIDGNQPLREAVKLMNKHDVGSLLITVGGLPRGHITRTRLLNELIVF